MFCPGATKYRLNVRLLHWEPQLLCSPSWTKRSGKFRAGSPLERITYGTAKLERDAGRSVERFRSVNYVVPLSCSTNSAHGRGFQRARNPRFSMESDPGPRILRDIVHSRTWTDRLDLDTRFV